MPTTIDLPPLGENIQSGDVLSILVKEGDVVARDQDLIEIETDKATMPIPSPTAGTVLKIFVAEGDTVAVGASIIELQQSTDSASPNGDADSVAQERPQQTTDTTSQSQAANAPQTDRQLAETTQSETQAVPQQDVVLAVQPAEPSAVASTNAPGDGHSSAPAGPAVRRLARELGVELRRVRPTGAAGRITEEDVRQYVRNTQADDNAKSPKGVTPPGMPDSDGIGAIRREKMSRMRQTIARNMLHSYSTIPQLTNFDDVDVTDLENMRQESKEDYAAQGIKLTAMPFLIKAVASGLKRHPVINASVADSGEEVIYKEYVNVGIAVDTERGLVVPVLRDADRKNIPQIAGELAKLAESARTGDYSLDDLRGGTFTISNLGAVGGSYSTPIINPPESAILLVGRSRMMPQLMDDQFVPRMIMPLSITYDHRIVDGAAAARFLNDVKAFLSNPGRLLLAP